MFYVNFASSTLPDRFAGVQVMESPEGVPAIAGAVAALVCTNHERIHAGDHLLLLGRVLRVDSRPGTPLAHRAAAA
jgi:flavin reductase (DIM6/NTAB) family NADH-FMN oxidoreductase RutF